MRRLVVPAALLALAATAAVLAVLPPAAAPPPGAAPGGPPVLSAQRVHVPAVRAAAVRRVRDALAALVGEGPAESCLLVRRGDREVFSHRPALPLVPASGTKLLTAVAAVHAGVGDGATVHRMLKDSDNAAAERLMAAVGRDALPVALAGAGIPLDGVEVIDGSGLDRRNRATCAALHAAVAGRPPGDPVLAGLAVAGEDGTLHDRFVASDLAGRLRAKTGSIRGVATLVGLVDAGGPPPITFAYVVNGLASAQEGAALQDELVAVLGRLAAALSS